MREKAIRKSDVFHVDSNVLRGKILVYRTSRPTGHDIFLDCYKLPMCFCQLFHHRIVNRFHETHIDKCSIESIRDVTAPIKENSK